MPSTQSDTYIYSFVCFPSPSISSFVGSALSLCTKSHITPCLALSPTTLENLKLHTLMSPSCVYAWANASHASLEAPYRDVCMGEYSSGVGLIVASPYTAEVDANTRCGTWCLSI